MPFLPRTKKPITDIVLKDIIALVGLLWRNVDIEYQARNRLEPAIGQWVKKVRHKNDVLLDGISKLDKMDPRRLKGIDPSLIRKAINSTESFHRNVSEDLGVIVNMVMIQRSPASELPRTNGKPVPMKGHFKKMVTKTSLVERRASEEQEYQLFHKEAAR